MENTWEHEHDLWLNDARQWGKEHVLIRAAINSLIKKLREYDVVLEYHRHQITDHQELMSMHDAAMNWHEKNVGSNGDHRLSDLVDLQAEAHRKEADLHKRLSGLHQEILRGSMDTVFQLGKLL